MAIKGRGAIPNFAQERQLQVEGYWRIAGIDEVGLGPLAGPVVAAAVLLSPEANAPWLSQVRDSKLLTSGQREALFQEIMAEALEIGIGQASPEEIDNQGLGSAITLAMSRAVAQCQPDFLLIDGRRRLHLELPQKALVGGDGTCLSIAAASIIAKVTRDRLMVELDGLYPGYGFAQHKGYPTAEHLANLQRLGVSPVHRKSFAPVSQLLTSA
ncbi:MAG: ribonuclease HII [Chloroflexi bacterium]|nr:ribonuclease HII [Chloroflexota bacterium]